MSDEESSDSDFDVDEMMQQLEGMKMLLHRQVGKHKDVARLQGSASQHWPAVAAVPLNLEGEDTQQTVKFVNDAEDNERKRRMSIPFTGSLTDDCDVEEATEQVTSMHEELLHLFAVYDAKFQAECERERRNAETVKQRMEEQLMKRARLRSARAAFEEERQRRIQRMESFLTEETEDGLAMAETNEVLSLVHQDLKEAFRLMETAKETRENDQRYIAEEGKEMLLQEIRRIPTKQQHKQDFEVARQQKIDEYNKLRQSESGDDLDRTLVTVQEDLLKLFGKLKKDKKVKKEETLVKQSDCKNSMQEELLHKTLGKRVSKLEAREKNRRIEESRDGNSGVTENKRQKTMDMLIGVQKQLLDVMSHTQMTSAKEQMCQLKFMNRRSNMLTDIRKLRKDQDLLENLDYGPSPSPRQTGRRLSTIGEKLEHHA